MSELVNYSTGVTVTSNWLNRALLREEGKASYVIYQTGGVTYAKSQTPAGTDYNDSGSPNPAQVIKNAIAALTSGGKIFLRNGTYSLASTLQLNQNNLVLEGECFGGVTLTIANAANIPLLVDKADYIGTVSGNAINRITLRNLIVDQNGANQTGSNAGGGNGSVQGAIELANAPYAIVENVEVKNGYDGNLIFTNLGGQSPNFPHNNVRIVHALVHDETGPSQTGDMMQTNGLIKSYVEDVYCYNSARSALTMGYCQQTTFKKITIGANTGSGGRGFSMEPANATAVQDIEVSDLDVSGFNGHQVFMAGASNGPVRVKFNKCRASVSGVGGNAGFNGSGNWLEFTDCDSFGNTGIGFYLSGTHLKFNNCRAWNNSDGFAFDNLISGITTVTVDDVILSNCSSFDNQGTPTQTYGFDIQSRASDTITVNILGGYVNGLKTAPLLNGGSGTNTILTRNIEGYNPQAASNVTAGASIWTYTNNDPYNEIMVLNNLNGGSVSAISYRGDAGYPTTVNGFAFFLQPGQTIAVTWATTAPTFRKYPQ